MIFVGRFGRGFQLIVCLVQQSFSMSGMTAQVPLVRLLRSDDLVIRLLCQPLGRSNVRMPIGINIFSRRVLRDGHATGNQTEPQGAC